MVAEEMFREGFLSEGAESSAIVRVLLSLSSEDPFTLLQAAVQDEERVFAWNDSVDGRCFVGLGSADLGRFQGEARFGSATETLKAWSRSLLSAEEESRGLPLAVGGFSFSVGAGKRKDTWQGWSDGELWIPELLVHRRGGQTSAAVTLLVATGESLESVEARMRRSLERLTALEPTATLGVDCRVGCHDECEDEPGFSRWKEVVERAVENVAADVLQKVVLARTARWLSEDGETFDSVGTVLALREAQDDCTVFLVRGPGTGDFVGATPEELVRLSGGWAHTAAVAGTRRRSSGVDESGSQDLLESEKDQREHRFVAETIRETLWPLLEGLQGDGVPSVVSYADVHHLRADFSGMVRDGVGLLDLVETLHPTPAVGGLPRERALGWLEENENLDRGWYSSPVGWVDGRGDGVFVVGIRSAIIGNGAATAYAGCGLVSQSDARTEWEESVAKLGPIRRGLVRRPVPERGAKP